MTDQIILQDLLTSVAGIVLSLLFSYFPVLNTWYAAKTDAQKKLLMTALVAGVAAGVFGLACANVLADLTGLVLACGRAEGILLVRAVVVAAFANQTTYLLTPAAPAVKQVKERAKAIAEGRADLEIGQG